jgi:hypothetical protein
MLASRTPDRPSALSHVSRADRVFVLGVAAAYLAATLVAVVGRGLDPGPIMQVAERALGGHLDSDALKGATDVAVHDGRYYFVIGPLQLLPHLPFAAVQELQGPGRYVVSLAFGLPAALLALPLARAYGARGRDAYWIAVAAALGTLLWFSSVFGNVYYLAHAQSFLALTLFLLEWTGRRRPLALGVLLGLSLMARPTTALAAVPFGLALLWQHRAAVYPVVRTALAFGLPLAAAVGILGWFNWLRFGSPLESGYAISYLINPQLEASRAAGLFSLGHVPENLRLALLELPRVIGHPPFLSPSKYGMSMLLVSPALLTAAWAGLRDRTARLLWLAAGLTAIPVFLYYGGGYIQYGFRYSLDFTPYLVALMAMGSTRWLGWPERLLVVASVASVAVGIIWRAML